jgi:tryptophanyl-tRNA synthetase
MKTCFSGIQPSGELHLGNYLGAIRNWVALQERFYCYFCIVDYHAITQDYEPKQMASRVYDMAVDVLACGVDPERSVLFVQSQVTADILLYKGEAVPVGADQVQHVELSRRIARAFNRRWGKVFPEPEADLSSTPKILGLDGKAKMSKSLNNTISLSATDKQIRKSLARAATDTKREKREDPGDPDVCNVFTLHKFFSDDDKQAWVREGCTTAGIGCADCKTALADNVIEHLTPIRAKREELHADKDKVRSILEAGAAKAKPVAEKTMAQVRKKLGLWS